MSPPSRERESSQRAGDAPLQPLTARRYARFLAKLKSVIQQGDWPIEQVMSALVQKDEAGPNESEVPVDPEVDIDEPCLESEESEVPFDPEADIVTPSAFTSPHEWKPFLFNELNKPRWTAYRGPPAATPAIPLVLLHKSFEDFCTRANASSCLGLNDTDYDLASYIWDSFSEGYNDEESEMTLPLNHMFVTYLKQLVTLSPGLSEMHTDGVVGYQDSYAKILFHDKRNGYFQALEYERKAFRENVVMKTGRLSHGMIVIRICPYIQFVAVVMDWESRNEDDFKGKIMGEPLTHQINCFGPKETGIHTLCKALNALKSFSLEYKPEPFIDVSLPYHLRDWTDVQRISQQRLVFSGKDGGSTKVAKFTSSYSYDAHAAWAQAGVACNIEKVEVLSSGWKLVVMELLSEADGWYCASVLVKRYRGNTGVIKKLREAIKAAIVKGHTTGYVHGDARYGNMFVMEMEVEPWFDIKLIDFDWAGPVGEAIYTDRLNPKIMWHQDAEYGKLIKPEHDYTFVDRLI